MCTKLLRSYIAGASLTDKLGLETALLPMAILKEQKAMLCVANVDIPKIQCASHDILCRQSWPK